MAMKKFSTFSKCLGQEPHDQMQFCVITRTFVRRLSFYRGAVNVFYSLSFSGSESHCQIQFGVSKFPYQGQRSLSALRIYVFTQHLLHGQDVKRCHVFHLFSRLPYQGKRATSEPESNVNESDSTLLRTP